MTRQNETAYGIHRLESKNARVAIIQKISADFNLMPIVAEAYYQQVPPTLRNMLMCDSPQGKSATRQWRLTNPQVNTSLSRKKVSCRLTLNEVADLQVLADYGLAGLRRYRILRLTQEAYDQNALLSYEDLAVLLTTSPVTIRCAVRNTT
jgi:hypothetical protein